MKNMRERTCERHETCIIRIFILSSSNWNLNATGVQEPDFSLYPNDELQTDWLTSYLEEYLGESLDQTDQRVATLKNQVNLFTIASHLCWTFWALVQTELSEIDFDYLK